jgi:hypothetical protein
MDRKSIMNQLKLAYSPLSNYEFNFLKHDKIIEQIIDDASIYIIAQRPVLSFENVISNQEALQIEFEIHQKNNPNILKCKLPYFQEAFGASREKEIAMAVNTIDPDFNEGDYPVNKAHGISLLEVEDINDENPKFLVWFSPEKFLQNYWGKSIEGEVKGDLRNFTNYKVHYVGKATKQSIFKRLTGHSTLQEILSVEYPFQYGELPTHEITLLLFKFHDNLEVKSFGPDSDIDEMVAALTGDSRPEQEKIFLDAEKALIKAMQPKYNKELFNNYPVSKDGLYQENYDAISYTFMDPVTLNYSLGEIEGGLIPHLGGDAIIIKDNETFDLIKHKE